MNLRKIVQKFFGKKKSLSEKRDDLYKKDPWADVNERGFLVEDLHVSKETMKYLKKSNIRTIGDILERAKNDIYDLALSKKMALEIVEELCKIGFCYEKVV